jgi:hypothetical protein
MWALYELGIVFARLSLRPARGNGSLALDNLGDDSW